MYLLNLFKILVSDLFSYFKTASTLAKSRTINPTCKFYKGSVQYNSIFGDYNVVFNDTIVFNSNIGSHTYIQKNTSIFNTEIGKFCSIAPNVTISPGLHYTAGVSTHPSVYLKNTPLVKIFSESDQVSSSKRTTIGHDVWIGQNAIILDGVVIGNGAIVAAGAVVNKDVEPYAIVGGIPAKPIKFRFDKETISKIENSKWWEFDENWFSENWNLLNNPQEFIAYLNDR